MNLFELGAFVCGIIGAVFGGMVASASLGVWGWLVGVPVGAILGFVVGPYAFLLVAGLIMLLEEGPIRLMRLLRTGRREGGDGAGQADHR